MYFVCKIQPIKCNLRDIKCESVHFSRDCARAAPRSGNDKGAISGPHEIRTAIPSLSRSAKERLGFPTQKPIKLLRRIIEVSTNPGYVVFDPFCGCGTAVYAAHETGPPVVRVRHRGVGDPIDRRSTRYLVQPET